VSDKRRRFAQTRSFGTAGIGISGSSGCGDAKPCYTFLKESDRETESRASAHQLLAIALHPNYKSYGQVRTRQFHRTPLTSTRYRQVVFQQAKTIHLSTRSHFHPDTTQWFIKSSFGEASVCAPVCQIRSRAPSNIRSQALPSVFGN